MGSGSESVDYLVQRRAARSRCRRRASRRSNTHGTGCSLSSAIAAELAKGEALETAVRNAKAFVSAAIASADRFSVGHGHGPDPPLPPVLLRPREPLSTATTSMAR